MTRHLIGIAGAFALSGLGLTAQTPAPTQPSAKPSPQPALGAVTLTGCVKPWDGSTMGKPPSQPAAAPASPVVRDYVLTNAEPTGAPEKTAAPDAQAHSTYLLKTGPAVDLAQHVNHKVEVAGSVVKTPAASPDPERGESSLKSETTPVAVTVVSLKMISTSCP